MEFNPRRVAFELSLVVTDTGAAQATRTFNFADNATYPNDLFGPVILDKVQCWGAGGNGGAAGIVNAGGGGGGGSFSETDNVDITGGNFTIAIDSGGNQSQTAFNPSVSPSVVAISGANAALDVHGAGGAGGTGTTLRAGGDGADAVLLVSGGGGSSAGTSSNGIAAVGITGGVGPPGGGAGGDGGDAIINGTDGAIPGGGGGGDGGSGTSGLGADGQIIVTYTVPLSAALYSVSWNGQLVLGHAMQNFFGVDGESYLRTIDEIGTQIQQPFFGIAGVAINVEITEYLCDNIEETTGM